MGSGTRAGNERDARPPDVTELVPLEVELDDELEDDEYDGFEEEEDLL
jgi:hypothetical protein